ncbi:MAG: diheme cytochrome c [Zoogloeaceae bacterium]|jgi:mono/diheme cytochrome c family protein|nr:diheme cytochrome c [Zoogloeaceae bacterium]
MSILRVTRSALLAAVLTTPLAASADKMPIPADAPAAFRAECGDCHMAFSPALLTAPDWRRVVGQLDQHYGDNVRIDEKTRGEIEAFLIRHASTRNERTWRRDRAAPPHRSDPPRLTGTPWFRREHREVPASLWRDTRVVSASNCPACHGRAEEGSFRKRELALPELQRRKEHH